MTVHASVKYVALNELGLRIGESHHKAILTDHEVDLMRDLHEEGYSYEWLSKKFEVSKWSVGRICRYERRAQTPERFIRVHKERTT